MNLIKASANEKYKCVMIALPAGSLQVLRYTIVVHFLLSHKVVISIYYA